MDGISREEAANIALAAAKEATRTCLNETFALLGVNLSNFESVEQFRQDVEWLRRVRKVSEAGKSRAWMTVISIASAGLAVAAWESVKALIRGHP